MSFEANLSKGRFSIPECLVCRKIIWPPAEFCSACFGQTSLREGDFEGKVLEFSSKDGECFCIVEFEDTIRIMAKRVERPEIGQKVRITKCGMRDGDYFFEVN